MNTIRKINLTRRHLKSYLATEWDVSEINDLSDKEVEIMYNAKVPHKSQFAALGQATGCNFSLQHLTLPSHILHVIYFQFPDLGEPPLKLTKTCADKIKGLYESDAMDTDDSLILIIANPISETVSVAIEETQLFLTQELSRKGLTDEIETELKEVEGVYNQRHLANIHLFALDHLAIDITDHVLVPTHECIRNEAIIQEILTNCNATREQFPIIQRTDPQAKVMRMAPGDICKIRRRTLAGEVTTYRVCA